MSVLYDFDEVIDRQGSDSIKWHLYERGVLPMWVADMDFRAAEPVLQALRERVDHGVFGYPEMGSRNTSLMSELSQVIVERMARLYNWEIQPDDLVFVPGVVTGFNLACHALAAPDGGVFVQTPVYYPMLHAAADTGSIHQEMQLTLDPDGTYSVDWELFERSLDERTRLFILCNPHNPVGKMFSRDELLKTAEICLRRGVTICSDEIHCDLLFDERQHIPMASLDPEIAQNTITLMAPSKTFNLPGLQCSFAIIQNPELRKRLAAARKGLVPWVNLMGLNAALAAYRDGGDWLTQLLTYLQANRDYLVNYVRENLPGIRVASPEATYLAWLDCRQAGIRGNPSQFFLEKARIGFNDGEAFGKGGEGFVRMNFGCPRSLLAEGLNRMKNALERLDK